MCVCRLSAEQARTEQYDANQVLKITSRNTHHLLPIKKKATCQLQRSQHVVLAIVAATHRPNSRTKTYKNSAAICMCWGCQVCLSSTSSGFSQFKKYLAVISEIVGLVRRKSQVVICGLKFLLCMKPSVNACVDGQNYSLLPPPTHRFIYVCFRNIGVRVWQEYVPYCVS